MGLSEVLSFVGMNHIEEESVVVPQKQHHQNQYKQLYNNTTNTTKHRAPSTPQQQHRRVRNLSAINSPATSSTTGTSSSVSSRRQLVLVHPLEALLLTAASESGTNPFSSSMGGMLPVNNTINKNSNNNTMAFREQERQREAADSQLPNYQQSRFMNGSAHSVEYHLHHPAPSSVSASATITKKKKQPQNHSFGSIGGNNKNNDEDHHHTHHDCEVDIVRLLLRPVKSKDSDEEEGSSSNGHVNDFDGADHHDAASSFRTMTKTTTTSVVVVTEDDDRRDQTHQLHHQMSVGSCASIPSVGSSNSIAGGGGGGGGGKNRSRTMYVSSVVMNGNGCYSYPSSSSSTASSKKRPHNNRRGVSETPIASYIYLTKYFWFRRLTRGTIIGIVVVLTLLQLQLQFVQIATNNHEVNMHETNNKNNVSANSNANEDNEDINFTNEEAMTDRRIKEVNSSSADRATNYFFSFFGRGSGNTSQSNKDNNSTTTDDIVKEDGEDDGQAQDSLPPFKNDRCNSENDDDCFYYTASDLDERDQNQSFLSSIRSIVYTYFSSIFISQSASSKASSWQKQHDTSHVAEVGYNTYSNRHISTNSGTNETYPIGRRGTSLPYYLPSSIERYYSSWTKSFTTTTDNSTSATIESICQHWYSKLNDDKNSHKKGYRGSSKSVLLQTADVEHEKHKNYRERYRMELEVYQSRLKRFHGRFQQQQKQKQRRRKATQTTILSSTQPDNHKEPTYSQSSTSASTTPTAAFPQDIRYVLKKRIERKYRQQYHQQAYDGSSVLPAAANVNDPTLVHNNYLLDRRDFCIKSYPSVVPGEVARKESATSNNENISSKNEGKVGAAQHGTMSSPEQEMIQLFLAKAKSGKNKQQSKHLQIRIGKYLQKKQSERQQQYPMSTSHTIEEASSQQELTQDQDRNHAEQQRSHEFFSYSNRAGYMEPIILPFIHPVSVCYNEETDDNNRSSPSSISAAYSEPQQQQQRLRRPQLDYLVHDFGAFCTNMIESSSQTILIDLSRRRFKDTIESTPGSIGNNILSLNTSSRIFHKNSRHEHSPRRPYYDSLVNLGVVKRETSLAKNNTGNSNSLETYAKPQSMNTVLSSANNELPASLKEIDPQIVDTLTQSNISSSASNDATDTIESIKTEAPVSSNITIADTSGSTLVSNGTTYPVATEVGTVKNDSDNEEEDEAAKHNKQRRRLKRKPEPKKALYVKSQHDIEIERKYFEQFQQQLQNSNSNILEQHSTVYLTNLFHKHGFYFDTIYLYEDFDPSENLGKDGSPALRSKQQSKLDLLAELGPSIHEDSLHWMEYENNHHSDHGTKYKSNVDLLDEILRSVGNYKADDFVVVKIDLDDFTLPSVQREQHQQPRRENLQSDLGGTAIEVGGGDHVLISYIQDDEKTSESNSTVNGDNTTIRRRQLRSQHHKTSQDQINNVEQTTRSNNEDEGKDAFSRPNDDLHLLRQILDDERLYTLIDVLYVDHHKFLHPNNNRRRQQGMEVDGDEGINNEQTSEATMDELLNLLERLRQKGIAAHAWV